MKPLQYDLSTYLTSVKMSSKIRIMVEGKDDRSHISNVINKLCHGVKFKVDVAAEIKGICAATGKNNRAKIERAHELVKGTSQHKKLLFLCDREIRGFAVSDFVQDQINGHYVDGQLSWTAGHSMENYFLRSELIGSGIRYLTSSAYKEQAVGLFVEIFPSMVKMIAAVSLAAHQLNSVSLPCGLIGWKNIRISGRSQADIDFKFIDNPLAKDLEDAYRTFKGCIDASELEVCLKLCRGHTAIIMVRRVFAACIFFVMSAAGDESAESEANVFDSLNEKLISNALSEEWIKVVGKEYGNYPVALIEAMGALAA
ncbi:MAG: DUF4435 domain-containing protein [Pseudomonas farsensis]|uniref:hypothetical protein n=1 Tax=Pseudomonas farsensis TaxID=2745492 RepID=UPI003C7C9605